ncbi:putative disease resistance RPP13-like protein 3 isoform X2 [Setaria italica]|uniref:putative disease resistance RPP13-like protein 3 isoform X2 n=1 Tax=Setaria italica TaxID=4555 RepID=UPI000350AD3D|nr:putative disease resistance RPP13-like protein 3 isoform X2 [Setaria italica]
MEVVTGALSSVITKLGDLLVGEYKLQKGVKGEIRFLQAELESMKGALEEVSNTPADQLHIQDKIWAKDLRELSYDIEDNIDTFMVRGEGNEQAKLRGIKKFIDRSVGLFRKAKVRHGIATEIRDIKSRVEEVAKRHDRYKLSNSNVAKHVTIDPRLLYQYDKVTELVGIEEARDEIIRILMEGNEVSKQQDKIISIVGFGGLGKTTLADVVYKKLRAQFECAAFVSVSQTPDLEELLKRMFCQLVGRESNKSSDVARELREFLENKRYFIVIDDIWNISDWKMIKRALPGDNVGNKIITTTRILNIAEQVGGAYNLQPISLNNSRTLFFRRIFGNGNKDNNENIVKCPDDELAEVSDRILKKCAGVPLAIITMASLLACKARDKMEWYEVCNSVGTGLENNLDVENMRKILSFSYYELPCHLRACLLYLSMFPEDYEIDKDRLIRMWIGEGFIQCEKVGKSLFELGESYFNELINRSMIQPIHDSSDDMISRCRVHDMVLDFIRSLSSEENFVTVLSNIGGTSPSNMIRRLSLQNSQESHMMAQTTWSLQHARSVVVFPASVSLVPPLAHCRVLHVLDLEECNLSQANSNLKYLGNLHHLRYLGLCKTGISQLPEEIENLQFLQTLDVRGTEIFKLTSSVVQLRKLMCLYIDWSTRVPNGIGNLTCLEQLSWLRIDDYTRNIIEELGQLTELRQLSIELDERNDKLLECLCKLQKMQELDIRVYPSQRGTGGLDAWVTPRHLRVLRTAGSCWFSTLPAWVNSSLQSLEIAVRELHQVDLEILGRLPALRRLQLEVDNHNLGILAGFVVGAEELPARMVVSTWAWETCHRCSMSWLACDVMVLARRRQSKPRLR